MNTDTIALLIVFSGVGLLVLVLTVGAVLVIRDTVRGHGNWGLNLTPVRCPQCGEPAPAVRAPKNLRQALWGGCTCARCGVEYDKWGQPMPGANQPGR